MGSKRGIRHGVWKPFGISFLVLLFVAVTFVVTTTTVLALSNVIPGASNFDTSHAYFTLSNTRDVSGSGSMGLTVWHKSATAPRGNVKLVFNPQGGTGQGGNQNSQGTGAAKYNINGGNYTPAYKASHGDVTLIIKPGDWVRQGDGWSVHIGGQLSPNNHSSDDSNHINIKLTAPETYILAPDGGYNFGFLQGGTKDQGGYCVNGSGDSCADTHDYFVPFAAACGLNPGDSFVNIHDMDQGNKLIQPQNLKVKIFDITNGAHTAVSVTEKGSEANGKDAEFHFNPVKNHKYQVELSNVNGNNVLQLKLPFDSANSLYDCNSPPTGGVNTTCNTDGTGHVAFHFSDPDGNTSAKLTINVAGGDPNYVYDYNTSGSYGRDINDAHAAGTWSAKLVVQDKDGSSDQTYTDSVSGGCDWALKATAAATPTSVYDGQNVKFTFNTQNTGGVKSQNFAYGDRLQYYKGTTALGSTISNGPNATTYLAAGASTPGPGAPSSTLDTWNYVVNLGSAPAGANKVCAWRAVSVTSSSNSTDIKNGPGNFACVTIILPACKGVTTSPPNIEPSMQFNVVTKIGFNTKASAQTAMAGSNYYIVVTGPEAADGTEGPTIYDNENVGTPDGTLAIDSTGLITGTSKILGPLSDTGTYDVHYGIKGGTAPQQCDGSFDVGNLPYFDVRGGDISAGQSPDATGTCVPDTTAGIESWNYDRDATIHPGNYGAGSQAAAYALAHIKSFATGINPAGNGTDPAGRAAAGALQSTLGSPTPHDYSFANSGSGVTVDDAGNYGGNFGALPCPENYISDISANTNTTWGDDYKTSKTYYLSGDQTLGGGTLDPDVVINLRVNGNVFLSDNIVYDDSGGPGHYPRLNIFATGNIYVNSTVSTLHGFFAAQQGIFATCAERTGSTISEHIGYSTCNTPLTVYGAVASKQLHLERTSGTLTSTSGPAEDFVYGPELWLSTPDCVANPTDIECSTTNAPAYDAFTSLPPVL